jgi:hypothetical protein
MRRVARRSLLIVTAAFALLVVLPTAMVWSRGGFIELDYEGGTASVSWRGPLRPVVGTPPPSRILADRRVLGVHFHKVHTVITHTGAPTGALSDTRRYLSAPGWYLALAAALVVAAFYFDVRRHRVLHGHCSKCGYDLRASPERCPECGAMAT